MLFEGDKIVLPSASWFPYVMVCPNLMVVKVGKVTLPTSTY